MFFLASRSILELCDHKIQNPESESTRIPSTYPQKDGETIYCHPTALRNFVTSYLPNVTKRFILVSGDSDTEVPTDIPIESNQLLQHPLLICWYAQNCVYTLPKLKQLPIGLDFHTLQKPTKGRFSWSTPKKQPIESQEQEVKTLIQRSASNRKQNKCYGNFHFLMNTRYGKDRIDAYRTIPQSLIYYEPTRVPRSQTWKKMIEYKFVVSPHGNGLDCHRTWEALVLGCIPIVKSSPLDFMYRDLPILIVNQWSDITQDLLDSYQVPPSINLQKLELSYWKSLLTNNVVSE